MRQPTVVIYDRLSRLHAEERPDHRINACKEYAAKQDWRVLYVAIDTNVSGAAALEDRPGMREVLARLPHADYVLAAKLDRYSRSVLEFERLLRAADSTCTTIVTADGVVSPENSLVMSKFLAVFAEHERNMIKARITESKAHFRSRGNHLGGLTPYGYVVAGPVNNKRWAIDESAASIIRECADRLLNHGGSITALTRDLNERGIPSPADHARQRDGRPMRGTRWSTTTLRDVLYTPAMRGWLVQADPNAKQRSALTNQPVLDSEGRELSAGAAILSGEDWSAVRDLLDRKAKGRGVERSGKSMLLHLARCSECDGPMYRQRRKDQGNDYSTYVCRNGVGKHGAHRANVIVAGPVEELVTADYLKRFGGFNLMRWAEPDGSAVLQLSEVNTQIERLAGNLNMLNPGGSAARLVGQQIGALEKRQAELQREAEHSEGRWEATGRTVGEEWATRDAEGRRALLDDLGARIVIRPATPGKMRRFDAERLTVSFAGPAWWQDLEPDQAHLAAIAMDEALS
jgi:DNA invertase Pin-like site-specific DNA recombinase